MYIFVDLCRCFRTVRFLYDYASYYASRNKLQLNHILTGLFLVGISTCLNNTVHEDLKIFIDSFGLKSTSLISKVNKERVEK